jgi:hypothetical protein
MSPGRVLYGHYVAKHVDLIWTGPGWENYRDHMTVQDNMDRLGGIEAIWVYQPCDVRALAICDIPKIMVYNEAYSREKTGMEIVACDPDHVMFHHFSDLTKWAEVLHAINCTSSFHNHASPIIPSRPSEERPIRALLTGVQSPEIYPLRYKLQLACQYIHGSEIREHPGYRTESGHSTRLQYRDYLGHLKKSMISLCCTSKYKYPLAKLFESIGCGAVPATDKPDCPMFESLIWPHCIQLEDHWAPDQIADYINDQDIGSIRTKQQNLAIVVEDRFTLKRWSDHLLINIANIIERAKH